MMKARMKRMKKKVKIKYKIRSLKERNACLVKNVTGNIKLITIKCNLI